MKVMIEASNFIQTIETRQDEGGVLKRSPIAKVYQCTRYVSLQRRWRKNIWPIFVKKWLLTPDVIWGRKCCSP